MSTPMPNASLHALSLKTIATWWLTGVLVVQLSVPATAQSPGAQPASSQQQPSQSPPRPQVTPSPQTTPSPQEQQEASRIRVNSELVLVNVVARDKKGNLVRDLKKEDFSLFEDNKQQKISSFDFEDVDQLQTAGAADATVSGVAGQGSLLRST